MVHHPTARARDNRVSPSRLHFKDAARRRLEKGISSSHGDFYAARHCNARPRPEGLIRAGCACYTTDEEIDRLIDGVREISTT
jgi:selenocysteine lyase/cysteine desulfurase